MNKPSKSIELLMAKTSGQNINYSKKEKTMLIKHFKGQPNDFIIRFRKGKAISLGNGLEFWYMSYNTVVAAVPTASQDAPFIFHEATVNFQQVAIQGRISFRISQQDNRHFHCCWQNQ